MTSLIGQRMAATFAIFLVLIVTCPRATAADQVTYESLSDVSIGRVFFSPKQREFLDSRRQGRAIGGAQRTVHPSTHRKPSEDSAGFIVNSLGESRIYSNGDFVIAAGENAVDFPGDVSVARQETPSSKPVGDDEHDKEPSDADN